MPARRLPRYNTQSIRVQRHCQPWLWSFGSGLGAIIALAISPIVPVRGQTQVTTATAVGEIADINSIALDMPSQAAGSSNAEGVAGAASIVPGQVTEDAEAEAQKKAKAAADARKKQEELKKKVATAHKPVYYLNDFSYVLDPAYRGYQLGDGLKRRPLLHNGRYDIGGEYRLRYHSENNMRGLGLTGNDDDFLLRRSRLYGNFEPTENLRVFAEMIDARSDFENFNPRGIEVNEYDMLNLFVDARLWSNGDKSLTARAGRQELLFGDQRVISPLDWANTRRTFDGYRATAKTKTLTVDGFWTNPVFPDAQRFDSPTLDQEFMGLYTSCTARKNETIDLYALRYLNHTGANDYDINTLGSRWNGSSGDFLWDLEGAYQGGRNTDGSDHDAGAFTIGAGHKLSASETNPILWLYFDWASGDDARGAGNGYHHLFPLAHRYNGLMDLYGRRNLGDANALLTCKPTKKLNMIVWYHYFWLVNGNDTPYSVVMTPFNPGNAPGSRDLGHELDLLGIYAIAPRQQLQVGFSYFWSGAYYSRTPGVPTSSDANFLYTQWSIAY
ncbi:MAG: alginate export family protein [Pirellulaceae bacterium]|nr:alginate export family protein [Pirellulaceae bacterium]